MLDKKIINFDGLSRYHEKLNEVFKTKQDVISDLDDIRSGAELGSTALQDIPDRSITFDKLDQDVLDELYGGLEIYSSVDELPDDAEQGSLASVVVNVPDIARPIEEYYIKATENSYLIKSLEYKESTEEWSFDVVFGAYGLDNNSSIPIEQAFNIYGDINNLNLYFMDNGYVVEDTLISEGELNTELLNKICELISSLGGVVLYGTYADENDTHFFVTDIDEHSLWSLNQVFNFICAGTQETTLYIKDINGWRNINEIKIVDSVNKLDRNAPQGSLASVVVNKIDEVKFSELYQPTSYEVNLETEVIDTTNLSSVSKISINSSYDTFAEIQQFYVILLSKDFDGHDMVGQAVHFGILLQEQQCIGMAMTLSLSTQEENTFELFNSNEDGTITVNEENLSTINNFLSSTEFVYAGVLNMDNGEFIDPSYADVFYKAIIDIQKTELYIKDVKRWKKFSQVEIVDNLEDDCKDKALSANMGKVLNEMISNISFSSGADAVTFKGYVNVGGKTDIDKIFNMMKVGDACLCVPSITGEDSYLPWILSGLNKNDKGYRIPLDKSLLSVDKSQFTISNVANLIAGKGEVKTYFTLDADDPYVVCPDLLLLAKVKADLKDFMKATAGISDTILNLIPDGTEMTACVGKVLRWSGGDWLVQHMDDLNNLLSDDNNLTHKYGYNYDMDKALETGIIGYTTICTSGLPSGIKENFTVIVNGSVDADPNYRTITQFAYGRTGSATNRVWTRVLFKAVSSGYADDFKPWVEISSENLKSDISAIGGSLENLYEYVGEVDNKISDIEDIRSGAALGATALQEVPAEYVTESELTGKGYSTKTYVDEKVAALVNGAPDTLDTLDELAAALKDNKDIVTVLENSITSKQDKIGDLDTIRSGAALGATALQEVPAEYVTESELAGKGYLTINDLSISFAENSDIDSLFS